MGGQTDRQADGRCRKMTLKNMLEVSAEKRVVQFYVCPTSVLLIVQRKEAVAAHLGMVKVARRPWASLSLAYLVQPPAGFSG